MEKINLLAGWIGVYLGFITGAFIGLFFHNENWLGGYASWPRRMIRLGHISFFGLALINFEFVFTVSYLKLEHFLHISSILFILGAVTMPLCCFLSAFRKSLKFLFSVPVTCLLLAVSVVIYLGFFR